MPQLNADRYVAEIEASTAGLAEILAEYDQSLPIPTCPEWTLRQLVTHVGRAHRWAAEITRTRSDAFIPFREVPDGELPDDRAEQRAWLHAGAARIVDAVREAGSDLVWSFTGPVPAGFWIRRMAHETLVHRADAQLAAGAEPEPVIEAEIAADAIDEWHDHAEAGFHCARVAAEPLDGVIVALWHRLDPGDQDQERRRQCRADHPPSPNG